MRCIQQELGPGYQRRRQSHSHEESAFRTATGFLFRFELEIVSVPLR